MSSFKKLNKQDAFVIPYEAHKHFEISGSDFLSVGINRFLATSSSYNNGSDIFNIGNDEKSGLGNTQYDRLVYNSLDQLYNHYNPEGLGEKHTDALGKFIPTPGYIASGYIATLYFDATEDGSTLLENASVLSIPKNLYGNNIKPGSFSIVSPSGSIASSYFAPSYIAASYFAEGGSTWISASDDGYGNLVDMITPPVSGAYKKIGDIIYSMGLVIITDSEYYGSILSNSTPSVVTFDSSLDIYTQVYNCRVRSNEFLDSYNPSYIDNDHNVNLNVTGSEFEPYVTSVGLYNDANELIAVGKMSQPVPKSQDTDMTFVVKMDI